MFQSTEAEDVNTMGKIEWAMWANEQALASGLSEYFNSLFFHVPKWIVINLLQHFNIRYLHASVTLFLF